MIEQVHPNAFLVHSHITITNTKAVSVGHCKVISVSVLYSASKTLGNKAPPILQIGWQHTLGICQPSVTSTASSVNKQKLRFAPNVYSDFKSGLALPVQITPPFVFKKAGHRLEEVRQIFCVK